MADQGRWFKLWVSSDDDPDLANLSLDDFARWCLFGIFLKKHGTNGSVSLIPPCTALVQKFRVQSFFDVMQVIEKFPNCTVSSETNPTVTWHNWLKYQGDFSTDRVRKFRDMKRSKKRREEKRGEEKREEEKKDIPLFLGVQAADTKPADTPDDLRVIWNEVGVTTKRNGLLGFVLCKDLSPTRKSKAASRLKEAELDWHRQVITRLGQSIFACGGSPPTKDHPKPFRASFDWYIENDTNCLKISEGKYDN